MRASGDVGTFSPLAREGTRATRLARSVSYVLVTMGLGIIRPSRADGPPPTPAQAADAARTAWEAKDDAALKGLAGRPEPDPWVVADALCAGGHREAALAFAKEVGGVEGDEDPAYVEGWKATADEAQRREALRLAVEAFRSRQPAKALEAVGERDASTTSSDVVAALTTAIRGDALKALGRLREASVALLGAAQIEEAIGWWRRVGRDLTTYWAAWTLWGLPE